VVRARARKRVQRTQALSAAINLLIKSATFAQREC